MEDSKQKGLEPWYQEDGSVKMVREIRLTVGEFLKMKPPKSQEYFGKAFVKKERVERHRRLIKCVLTNPMGAVVVNDGVVISGNTRRQAAELEVEAGRLDPNFRFPAKEIMDRLSKVEETNAVADANDTNKRNWRILACKGDSAITKKQIGVVYRTILEICPYLPEGIAQNLAPRIAGIFNKNPMFEDLLAKERPLDIFGYHLYTMKGQTICSPDFRTVEPTWDLNKYVSQLRKLLTPAVLAIGNMKRDGLWNEKFGDSTTFMYTVFALSLRGKLEFSNKRRYNGTLTTASLVDKVNRFGGKIRPHAVAYNGNPEGKEDSILAVLGVAD